MKHIRVLLAVMILVALAFSCKSTKEVATTTEPEQPVSVAQPSQEDFDYYNREQKKGGLDPADVEQVVNYAKAKANLVCKIQFTERQGEENPQIADENKRKIVSLEQNIKALDKQNESFMDNEDKWRYYNKVYEKEMERCQY